MDDEDLISHILTGEGIRNYSQDLRALSAEELRALFAFASSGKINATRVIKNLIWQAYTAIRAGQRAPLAGNLRSLALTQHSCHQPQTHRSPRHRLVRTTRVAARLHGDADAWAEP